MLEIVQDLAQLALDSTIRPRCAISMSYNSRRSIRDLQQNICLKIACVFMDQGTKVPGIDMDAFINDTVGSERKEISQA